MKPYNSFCVDSLHVGPTFVPSTSDEKFRLESYLHTRGLDLTAFQYLLKGMYPSR